jgi:hypothetical protein
MGVLSALWPLPLGFIAGLLAVPFIFRWLLLVLASLGRLPGNLGTAAQRPQKSGLVLAVVHPVPWLLVIGLVAAVLRVAASPSRAEWLWFLAGIAAAPLLNGVLVYRAVRRARRRRAN